MHIDCRLNIDSYVLVVVRTHRKPSFGCAQHHRGRGSIWQVWRGAQVRFISYQCLGMLDASTFVKASECRRGSQGDDDSEQKAYRTIRLGCSSGILRPSHLDTPDHVDNDNSVQWILSKIAVGSLFMRPMRAISMTVNRCTSWCMSRKEHLTVRAGRELVAGHRDRSPFRCSNSITPLNISRSGLQFCGCSHGLLLLSLVSSSLSLSHPA